MGICFSHFKLNNLIEHIFNKIMDICSPDF